MDGRTMANDTLHLHSIGYKVFSHSGEEDMAGIFIHILQMRELMPREVT